MNNKKKNILVWIFTWAALLLVVLYSPIGSPDLYSSSDYYAGIPNANLSGSNTTSPGFTESGGDYNELDVPDYSSAESSTKQPSGSYGYTTPSSDNTSSGAGSYVASETQSYQNLKDGSSGAGGGGSTFISNNGSGGGSDASSAVSMTSGGITTLSSAAVTTNSTLQAAPPSQTTGHHPPHDPTQPAIPVGDGWVFLLLLAVGYGIIKKRFFAIE